MSEVVLSPDEHSRVQTVVEDLEQLQRSWTNSVSNGHMRRESTVLRRLLVDGEYSAAWRLMGLPRSPLVRAPDLDAALGELPRKYLACAFAPAPSGVSHQVLGDNQMKTRFPMEPQEGDLMVIAPAPTAGFVVSMVIPKAESAFMRDMDEVVSGFGAHLNPDATAPFWVSAWLESPSGYIADQLITRRDVIKYVANRLGGAHYGATDKVAGRRIQQLLDPQYLRFNDRPVVYMELLNIGRTIADSTDAYRLQQAFSKLSPPPDPFSD